MNLDLIFKCVETGKVLSEKNFYLQIEGNPKDHIYHAISSIMDVASIKSMEFKEKYLKHVCLITCMNGLHYEVTVDMNLKSNDIGER